MTLQRIVLAVVLSLQAGCVMAIQANTFPKWTGLLMLAGTVMQAFMSSVGPVALPAVPPTPPVVP